MDDCVSAGLFSRVSDVLTKVSARCPPELLPQQSFFLFYDDAKRLYCSNPVLNMSIRGSCVDWDGSISPVVAGVTPSGLIDKLMLQDPDLRVVCDEESFREFSSGCTCTDMESYDIVVRRGSFITAYTPPRSIEHVLRCAARTIELRN